MKRKTNERTLAEMKAAAFLESSTNVEPYTASTTRVRILREQRLNVNWSDRGRKEMTRSRSSTGRDSRDAGAPVRALGVRGLYFSCETAISREQKMKVSSSRYQGQRRASSTDQRPNPPPSFLGLPPRPFERLVSSLPDPATLREDSSR